MGCLPIVFEERRGIEFIVRIIQDKEAPATHFSCGRPQARLTELAIDQDKIEIFVREVSDLSRIIDSLGEAVIYVPGSGS